MTGGKRPLPAALAMTALWLAAALWSAPADPALAWGQEGHSIVAEIAQRRLSKAALREVNALLASELPDDLKGAQFALASIASWPDDYRADHHDETSRWHFVDIPYDRDDYSAARDCALDPKFGDCIIDELPRARATLADCSKADTERAMALSFVVHFIGDLHQPLHATTRTNPDTGADDRGGNDIEVTFLGEKTNLHKVWDTNLIMHKVYDWGEYVRLLETKWLHGRNIAELQAGEPVRWAEDAHKAGQLVAYNFRPDHVLDEEYYRDGIAVVDQQLALAGVRLARVLNEALQCPAKPAR
jgi:hypothetical protein